eukprot:2702217-Rhodomonas_salina.4
METVKLPLEVELEVEVETGDWIPLAPDCSTLANARSRMAGFRSASNAMRRAAAVFAAGGGIVCAGSFTAHCLSAQPEVGGVRSCPPSWDDNWDLRKDAETTNIVRHIVLVRHGQYCESQHILTIAGRNSRILFAVEKGKKDEEQKLTPLGREQAVKTGKRLAEYLPKDHTFKLIRQSNMTRAKETAGNSPSTYSTWGRNQHCLDN